MIFPDPDTKAKSCGSDGIRITIPYCLYSTEHNCFVNRQRFGADPLPLKKIRCQVVITSINSFIFLLFNVRTVPVFNFLKKFHPVSDQIRIGSEMQID
jgi:hypothetical protein